MPKELRSKIDCLVISDLHLGDELTRCEDVLEVLDKYDYKKLVLNGDILNGLRFKRLHTGHWQILSRLRELSNICEVVWVHGNHDTNSHILSQLLGIEVCNRHIWEWQGKRYLAIHGHQYDHFLHDNIIKSYLAFGIYHVIKSIDHNGMFTHLIKDKSAAWKRSSEEVQNGAMRLAKSLGADCVFCGHIHKVVSLEKNGIRYFNTGSWNDRPSGYVTIIGNQVQLHNME